MTDENAPRSNEPEIDETPVDLDPNNISATDAEQVKGGSIIQAKNDMQKGIIANFRV